MFGPLTTLLSDSKNVSFFNILVSMGKLIKQAIADETKSGLACKPYVEKEMLGMYN